MIYVKELIKFAGNNGGEIRKKLERRSRGRFDRNMVNFQTLRVKVNFEVTFMCLCSVQRDALLSRNIHCSFYVPCFLVAPWKVFEV